MPTRTNLPILAFAVLILVAGAWHGMRTERWTKSAHVDDAVARLGSVPLSLGDWRGEAEPLDAEDLARSGIKGHAMTRYRNAATGEMVSLLIVCGRPGPISVHEPDVCYGGAGFEAVGEQFAKEVSLADGRTVGAWAMKFKTPPTLASAQIEVTWLWNGGSVWMAPKNPRWEFARYPVLYKLYVIRELPTATSDGARDPSAAFLQTFLPKLEQVFAGRSEP